MLVKDQHQIGNALHQHLRRGSTPLPCGGRDLGGGQGRDERFLPQNLLCQPDAPPDRTCKEGPHGVQIELVRQRRVKQLQVGLPPDLGVQIGRGAVKRHALHKGVDGCAALSPGHAGFLQKSRAFQCHRAGRVGHGADADLGGHLFQRRARTAPGKAGLQHFHHCRVCRGGGRCGRLFGLLRQGQHADGQRRAVEPVMRQKARVLPQCAAVRVEQRRGQDPARPARHAAHGLGAGGLGGSAERRELEGGRRLFQRHRDK